MVCTSFQNYHNFPNKKVILYIQPDRLFPSIKPSKFFLMLISILFLMHLQSIEFQGNEIMLERRATVRKTEQSKKRKKNWAHLLSTPSTFWTQRKAPGAGYCIGRCTSAVFCNVRQDGGLWFTLLFGGIYNSKQKCFLKTEIN